jgi:hypothetical protein
MKPYTVYRSLCIAVLLMGCGLISDAPTHATSTSFAAGRVRMDIPTTLHSWKPPHEVLAQMGPRPGATWYAQNASSFRLMVSRDETLRQDSVADLCAPDDDADKQLAGVGAQLLDRETVRVGGTLFCRTETRSGTVVTLQHVGVIEGRAFVVAAFFDQRERTASGAILNALLKSFVYMPTQEGSSCDPVAEPAMCFDDKHMGVCKNGHWTLSACDELCRDHGGPGEGCIFFGDEKEFRCMCGPLPTKPALAPQ